MDTPSTIMPQPLSPFRAALFVAHAQFMGAPRSIDLDDFMCGERRAMWLELENLDWAEKGMAQLDNDEEQRPGLGARRRTQLVEVFQHSQRLGMHY